MNGWPSLGGGCFWSWFTCLESWSVSSSPTSLRLLMFPQVWSRLWCSYNLKWDFLLLGWKWGIVILLFEFFTFLGRCWSLQCTLGELLVQAEMLHMAGESGQCLWKSHCVWHAASNTTPPFQLLISGLGPIPAPWQGPGSFGHCLSGKLWSAFSSAVAACPHPC